MVKSSYNRVEILCKKYGIFEYSRISKVYLAGGMGLFLDSLAAVEIGLFPKELADRTIAVGNAALEGAFLYQKEKDLGAYVSRGRV